MIKKALKGLFPKDRVFLRGVTLFFCLMGGAFIAACLEVFLGFTELQALVPSLIPGLLWVLYWVLRDVRRGNL